MSIAFCRFVFLVFPYVLCTTLAALLLCGEDVKKHLSRFFLYCLIASLTQTLTYEISNEILRFIVEIASGFLVAMAVFRKRIRWVFKIYASSYVIGMISASIAVSLITSYYGISVNEIPTAVRGWISIAIPAFISTVIVAYLIRRAWLPGLNFIYELQLKSRELYSIIIALFVQATIYVALVTQVAADYSRQSILNNAVIISSFIIIFGLTIYVLLKYMEVSHQEIKTNQETVSENIMEMIHTIRGQRHDYMNHLQIIYGLSQMRNNNELEDYIASLIRQESVFNEMLQIDNPIISALINAKISQAELKGINIYTDFKVSLAHLAHRSLDFARIMGNLIDNALDAVEEAGEKWVRIKLSEQDAYIICSVSNPFHGNPEDLLKIFNPGVSSKKEHSGLGLFSSHKLARKLHGQLDYILSAEQNLTFNLVIPK